MNEFIHDPESERARRRDGLSSKNDVESGAHADEAGKTLAAARGRDDAKLNLGQTDHCLWMVGGNAVPARERRLEAAAKTSAVNGRDDGLGKGSKPLDQRLP